MERRRGTLTRLRMKRISVGWYPSSNDSEPDAVVGVDEHKALGIIAALEMKRLVLGAVDMRHLQGV
jgi:hypothetical protein